MVLPTKWLSLACLGALACSSLTGCTQPGTQHVRPELEVTPPSLDFASAELGTSVELGLALHNPGRVPVTILTLELTGESPGEFGLTGPGPVEVAPSDSAQLVIRFVPTRLGNAAARLRLTSDAPTAAEVLVPLAGTGLASTSCSPGTHRCAGQCVDDTSAAACGAACTPCPSPPGGAARCTAGACGFGCDPGFQVCGSACCAVEGRLAAGARHTCALTPSGQLKCWGQNAYGQLGNGLSGAGADSSLPVAPAGLPASAAVSAGDSHTCALTLDGGVRCWGSDDNGQLGNGQSDAGLFFPLAVEVTGLGSGVSAVTSGLWHSCAITSAGALQCWGSNHLGEIGDGSPDSVRSTPSEVVGLSSGVLGVAAGAAHTCALTAARGVKCWGDNSYGEIGAGALGGRRSVPTEVVGLSSGVQAIAAGSLHTCALLAGGTVQCWGYGRTGQLGDGSSGADRAAPVAVAGLSNVTRIAAGHFHTCALVGGEVWCWGSNGAGALGDGTTIGRASPVKVVGLAPLVQSVSGGWASSCALVGDGRVQCWGDNSWGELGDGTFLPRLTPVEVSSFP